MRYEQKADLEERIADDPIDGAIEVALHVAYTEKCQSLVEEQNKD